MSGSKPEIVPYERAIERLEEGLARYRADGSLLSPLRGHPRQQASGVPSAGVFANNQKGRGSAGGVGAGEGSHVEGGVLGAVGVLPADGAVAPGEAACGPAFAAWLLGEPSGAPGVKKV